MELRIQSVKFDATEKLQAYIEKKMEKITKFCPDAHSADVVLKVVKPETDHNKDVSVTVMAPSTKFYAQKEANSFEEAFDECLSALEKQLEKHKDRH
ncbi:MAG: ribosome-associated translation inhibitor RaiA [Paludibacteraceae bacterium]|nr:ribosome-associated translation inhibitor RaiA [Paludibacteraceae bacterium]